MLGATLNSPHYALWVRLLMVRFAGPVCLISYSDGCCGRRILEKDDQGQGDLAGSGGLEKVRPLTKAEVGGWRAVQTFPTVALKSRGFSGL